MPRSSVMQKLAGQPAYYWEIMLPRILGVIVGDAIVTYAAHAPRVRPSAQP